MPEDIIEMLWRCGDKGCNHENKGRHKKCARCGRPKTEEDGFYMPGDTSHAAAVTDGEMLRQAKGGEDWLCRFCSTRQFRADKICDNCGVDQAQGVTKEARSTADPVVPMTSYIPSVNKVPWLPIVGGGGGMILFIWFLFWAFTPKIVSATVAGASWNTVVHVDRYTKYAHDGFSPPGDAIDVKNIGTRVHHYDHVLTGNHQEPYQHDYSCGQTCRTIPRSCYTTPRSCRSNKNGYATCTGGDQVCTGGGQSCSTKYCTETLYRTVNDYTDIPQFAPFYIWQRWEWGHDRDVPASGVDLEPVYADPHLRGHTDDGEDEREAGRELDMTVTFTDGKDRWYYKPRDVSELSHYPTGRHYKIKVGALSSVEVLP